MTLSAKQVLVLINPRSGISNPAAALLPAIEQIWHPHCPNIIHQFSHSADDGRSKARNAVAAGADGVFLEVHDDPARARSDKDNAWPIDEVEALMNVLLRVYGALGEPR